MSVAPAALANAATQLVEATIFNVLFAVVAVGAGRVAVVGAAVGAGAVVGTGATAPPQAASKNIRIKPSEASHLWVFTRFPL